jgi:hypothetical protein
MKILSFNGESQSVREIGFSIRDTIIPAYIRWLAFLFKSLLYEIIKTQCHYPKSQGNNAIFKGIKAGP